MATERKKPTKTEIKALEKKLKSSPDLVWDVLSAAERKEALEPLAKDYKAFLDRAKTEREAAREIENRALAAGFSPSPSKNGRMVIMRRGKVVFLAVPGKKPPSEGLNLIVSHIDAPRLDLKPRSLYEEVDLALLKTHYYGGIKKYQWLARPLALHGHFVKEDGRTVNLVLGESPDDPVLTIADLLPHLARKVQGGKKVSEAFPGEKLNLITGSLPLGGDDVKERFKLAVLDYFNREGQGLVEDDFISAEIEAVPAGPARDVGVDRSLIGAYGQDDRICAFSSLKALVDARDQERTTAALFVDKEEIGSEGATGAQSRFLEDFLAGLLEWQGQPNGSAGIRQCMMNTLALSADVEGAMDPDFQDVHEKMNAARLGYGVCVTKYTGSGGKYGASEASAEHLGWLRGVFKTAGVVWQPSLLGKIDEGGGGTVAMFLAKHGMEVVDCGPPVLGMHSPFEITSKADLFMTVRAYRAFYQAAFAKTR